MNEVRVGVLVSGRGSNLQALIEGQRQAPYKVVQVLSNTPEATALEKARNAGVEGVYLPGKRRCWEERAVKRLQNARVDLVCLAGFMQILSPVFLQSFPHIMNIHPSLLPAFPGLKAQEQALQYGVRVSGCTVHFVWEGLDTGPIILQTPVPVHREDTVESLSRRILKEEHCLYPRAVSLFARGLLKLEGRRVLIMEGVKI